MSYAIVRQAIVERTSLTAHYDDYIRYFSPHILGKHINGVPIVIAFQYDGGKARGPLLIGGEWCAASCCRDCSTSAQRRQVAGRTDLGQVGGRVG